jgi:hypothetical protein
MQVSGIKGHVGTLQKVKNLLKDDKKKLQGVAYTNSFFTKRYLARAHALVDSVNITENTIKLQISTRVEAAGVEELSDTLDVLVHHEAGDIPAFISETDAISGLNPERVQSEQVSVTTALYNVDLLLIMKDVSVTYQEFSIAGKKMTLVNLHHRLGELDEESGQFDFEQTVSLLFVESQAFYFFGNFMNQKLSTRDTQIMLELIAKENITGKAIKGVQLDAEGGALSTVYPNEGLLSAYYSMSNDLVLGSSLEGYIRIGAADLKNYRMSVRLSAGGKYALYLENKQTIVVIFTD